MIRKKIKDIACYPSLSYIPRLCDYFINMNLFVDIMLFIWNFDHYEKEKACYVTSLYYLSIYLSIHPSIYPSFYLSLHPAIRPSAHIPTHPYIYVYFKARPGHFITITTKKHSVIQTHKPSNYYINQSYQCPR